MFERLHFTRHAVDQMRRRGISESEVRSVLRDPQLTRPGDAPGKTVYERRLDEVVCVVIVDETDPTVVVTAFKK